MTEESNPAEAAREAVGTDWNPRPAETRRSSLSSRAGEWSALRAPTSRHRSPSVSGEANRLRAVGAERAARAANLGGTAGIPSRPLWDGSFCFKYPQFGICKRRSRLQIPNCGI